MLQRGPKDHTIYFNLIDEGREDSLAGKNTTLPEKGALDTTLEYHWEILKRESISIAFLLYDRYKFCGDVAILSLCKEFSAAGNYFNFFALSLPNFMTGL